MKKIINGKKYDTATAKKVGDWDNLHQAYIHSVSDFGYRCDELFRKTTGELFLRREGRGYFVDEIVPMDDEAAKKWAEKHVDGDEFEKIFGEVAE